MRARRATTPRERIISHEVTSLRRRVWSRRIIAVAMVAALIFSWQAYMNSRYAHMRVAAVALAADSQAYSDTWSFLRTPLGQLTLQATVTQFGRSGAPGPLSPTAVTLTRSGSQIFARLTGLGSVSETGAPVIAPISLTITGHTLDGSGRVATIEVECSYSYCWDRSLTSGRMLEPGDPLPAPAISDTVTPGNLTRHSDGFRVLDRVKLAMSNRSGRWEPREVLRISVERLRPS